jgi:hypothetical protein
MIKIVGTVMPYEAQIPPWTHDTTRYVDTDNLKNIGYHAYIYLL